jgi:hypothetical protein
VRGARLPSLISDIFFLILDISFIFAVSHFIPSFFLPTDDRGFPHFKLHTQFLSSNRRLSSFQIASIVQYSTHTTRQCSVAFRFISYNLTLELRIRILFPKGFRRPWHPQQNPFRSIAPYVTNPSTPLTELLWSCPVGILFSASYVRSGWINAWNVGLLFQQLHHDHRSLLVVGLLYRHLAVGLSIAVEPTYRKEGQPRIQLCVQIILLDRRQAWLLPL